MRTPCWVLVVGLLLGCPTEEEPPPGPSYVVPDGATAGWYDPTVELTTFPDDFHTMDDPATPTGLAVDIQPEAEAVLRESLPAGFTLIEALEDLDGWGTLGAVILRFTDPVDPSTFSTVSVRLIRLEGEGAPEELPLCDGEWTDEDSTLILIPRTPLAPETLYGVVVLDMVLDAAGEPIWASPTLHDLLHGTSRSAALSRLHGRYEALLSAAELEPDEVVAATVFTTQSLFDQDREVAQQIQDSSPSLEVTGACQPESGILVCPAEIEALDYLGEDQHFDLAYGDTPAPVRSYTLPVHVLLPDDGTGGPWPVMIYGHGLGGSRDEAKGAARRMIGLGVAVVAVDAPAHNEHPTNPDNYEFLWIFEFFGLKLEGEFDVMTLRDHWRQAAWDKLQIAEALRAGVELDHDGDGTPDLDGSRIYYSGHSLGGIMGPQLLALDPSIPAADLSVPGGRVSDIVYRGEIFGPLIELMAPDGTAEGDVARFFPMLQAAVERGDAGNWGTQVLDGDRDVLQTMVIPDGIVPNETNVVLARALGVQHAPPVLLPIPELVPTGPLPVSGNLDGHTAVLYQFDEKLQEDQLVPADHEDAHSNGLALAQLRHWWSTVLAGGPAEVIDPYEELGL